MTARFKRLRYWLRGKWFDWKNRHYRFHEGWCMCGDKIDNHGYGSGHGPVDSWYYYRDQYVYGDNSERTDS